ncbi:TIR domain-containing protein [Bacteroides mediterraneensis]|uniref:Nucleotide-binding protein n=1 Tax=Bacteroides mediterraneensis TaxID=1841856 RepID=A0ABS2EYP5_9BACE|nr:nucleotide-binding protein [Bacteroides mediterraneensis]MBM6759711.1 nucleotide-binding protein [Bacteroides mediterraneensis]
MSKPKLFIGSSVEGLIIARAIKAELEYDMDVTVWNQGVFKLSHTPLEDLSSVLEETDFASFIFLPEDKLEIKGEETTAIRDNVVFELGLFYGKLGRNRVSFVMPRGYDFHLPTDLTGLNAGTFEYPCSNLQASVGTYCEQIRQQIKSLSTSLPEKGYFGKNILNPNVSCIYGKASFFAIIPVQGKIIVKIESLHKKLSYGFPVQTFGRWRGDAIQSTDNYIQYFQAEGPFNDDAEMYVFDDDDLSIQIFDDNINNAPIVNHTIHISKS